MYTANQQSKKNKPLIASLSFPRYYVRFRVAASTVSKVRQRLSSANKLPPSRRTVRQRKSLSVNVSPCDLKARGNETAVFDNSIAWINDSFYSAGILGFGLYLLLGITSLPSVSNALSWREFSFIQVDPDVRVQHMLAFGCLGAWPEVSLQSAGCCACCLPPVPTGRVQISTQLWPE